MKFARHVFEDLIERRLAPVAALLLLALVAVPLTLSKSMPKDVARAAAPTQGAIDLTVPAMQPVVALASPDGRSRLEHLQALNPFQQRHKPVFKAAKAAAPTGGAPTTSTPSTPSTGTTPSTSTGTTPSTGGGSTAAAPSPPAVPAASVSHPKHGHARYYLSTLNVKFGLSGHHLTARTLTGDQPIPSTQNPVVIFTGFGSDRRTVQMLVSDSVYLGEGDARCQPRPEACTVVYLKARQTEFFDVAAGGGIRRYQLDVVSIGRKEVSRKEFLDCNCRRFHVAKSARATSAPVARQRSAGASMGALMSTPWMAQR
jgi:hypothetical protein